MTTWHREEQQCKKQSVTLMIVATCCILVVRAAVSVLVMMVMMVRSGVVVFLIQRWGVGGAKAFSLFLGLLENTAVGQSAKPAQQLPINLCSRQQALLPDNHWWRNKAVGAQDSYLSPALLLPVKGALLFALLTCLWGSILLLWVSTALALRTNKCCDNITVLAGFGLRWTEQQRTV